MCSVKIDLLIATHHVNKQLSEMYALIGGIRPHLIRNRYPEDHLGICSPRRTGVPVSFRGIVTRTHGSYGSVRQQKLTWIDDTAEIISVSDETRKETTQILESEKTTIDRFFYLSTGGLIVSVAYGCVGLGLGLHVPVSTLAVGVTMGSVVVSIGGMILSSIRSSQHSAELMRWRDPVQMVINERVSIGKEGFKRVYFNQNLIGKIVDPEEGSMLWLNAVKHRKIQLDAINNETAKIKAVHQTFSSDPLEERYVSFFSDKHLTLGVQFTQIADQYHRLTEDYQEQMSLINRTQRAEINESNADYNLIQGVVNDIRTVDSFVDGIYYVNGEDTTADYLLKRIAKEGFGSYVSYSLEAGRQNQESFIRDSLVNYHVELEIKYRKDVNELFPQILKLYQSFDK